MIVVVGVSHRSTPIEVRERLAIAREAVPEVLARLTGLEGIGEAVLLSTCNRVEVYAAARAMPRASLRPTRGDGAGPERAGPTRAHDAGALGRLAHAVSSVLAAIGGSAVAQHLVRAEGQGALLHLFRVAASLDSLVVGEPQILGQLKDAIELSREHRAIGPTLESAMHRAVRVGKRVRSETQIGAGQVSVSSVAVDLAKQIFGELAGHTALLVGAGEMAEAAARLLVRSGARLLVVNRSAERASLLAKDVGGQPRSWSELEGCVVEADIVVSSTSSPHYVLPYDLVKRARKARRGRSLFLIDIAVPRDVDPSVNELDNVYLYDVDDLSQVVAESLEGRAVEAGRAEAIVREEAKSFELWTLERAMTPAIVGLRARTRSILSAEVERSLSGKLRHLSAADREALAVMIDAATNKLLHEPVTRLKTLAADPRAGEYVEALRELFDLPVPESDADESVDHADEGAGSPGNGSSTVEDAENAEDAEKDYAARRTGADDGGRAPEARDPTART